MGPHSYTPRLPTVADGGGAVVTVGFVAALAFAAVGEVAAPEVECDEHELLLAAVAAYDDDDDDKSSQRTPKPTKETTDQQKQQRQKKPG